MVQDAAIDLGRGQPDPRLLPLRQMQRASASALSVASPSALQYGPSAGWPPLIEALREMIAPAYGQRFEAAQIMITAGASHGLDLALGRLTKPGDAIFVEEPTYFYAKEIIEARYLRPVPIPVGPQGLDLDALDASSSNAKVLYTIPSFHNPSTVTMPEASRARLIGWAQAQGVTVIADEVYQLLGYDAPPPRALAGRPGVVSLGSFSKILAPGLRLGWVIASEAHVEALKRCGVRRSGGGVSPFSSLVVTELITSGALLGYLDELRSTYPQRLAVLRAALAQGLPEFRASSAPEGGFFVWGAVPGLDTQALQRIALAEHAVSFRAGGLFSWRGAFGDHLRLSFTYYDEPELREGVSRLASAVRACLES